MVPFDSFARAELYDTYRTPLRFDAHAWGPTTKIRVVTVTQNQKLQCKAIFQKYMHVGATIQKTSPKLVDLTISDLLSRQRKTAATNGQRHSIRRYRNMFDHLGKF